MRGVLGKKQADGAQVVRGTDGEGGEGEREGREGHESQMVG